MIIALGAAYSRIRLPADRTKISLDSPLSTTITNYIEAVVLVNQDGDTLVNQNADTLVVGVVRSARTNVVHLGV